MLVGDAFTHEEKAWGVKAASLRGKISRRIHIRSEIQRTRKQITYVVNQEDTSIEHTFMKL